MNMFKKCIHLPTMNNLQKVIRFSSTNLGTFIPSSKTQNDRGSSAVILLGWAYSKPHQVEKFAEMHQGLGHHTLTYIANPELFLGFDVRGLKQHATELIQQLKQESPDTKNVFVHTFSNNGYCLYQQMGPILHDDPDLKFCGAILDSGPAPWSKRAYLINSNNYSPKESIIVNLCGYFFLYYTEVNPSIIASLKATWKFWPKMKSNWDTYIPAGLYSPAKHLIHEKLRHPLLVLYSTRDWQIPVAYLREAIAQQQAKGRAVKAVNFVNSLHVAHLKEDPHKYQQSCEDFMNRAITENKH